MTQRRTGEGDRRAKSRQAQLGCSDRAAGDRSRRHGVAQPPAASFAVNLEQGVHSFAERNLRGNSRSGAMHYNWRRVFGGEAMARILYCSQQVDPLGRESKRLPASRVPVSMLPARRRTRGGEWTNRLRDEAVQVTFHRKLAALDALAFDADDAGSAPRRR
jgi:hypothetical protein